MAKFPKLSLKRIGKFWWIVGDEEDGPYGPYTTKTEANEDRLGIGRAMRHEDDHSYFTCDPNQKMKEN